MYQGEKDRVLAVTHVLGGILIGGVIALAVGILFLTAASVGISTGWLTEKSMGQLAAASCAVGAFVGGAVTGRERMRNLTVYGALVGLALFALLVLAGTVLYDGVELNKNGAIMLASCLCGGALSGVTVRHRKGKGRPVRERKRKRKR